MESHSRNMAKNSDKQALLEKRRKELIHACTNNFADHIISRRAEKLRLAALGLIKKELGRYEHIKPSNRHDAWQKLVLTWNNITVNQIIELAKTWPEHPTLRALGYLVE